MTAPFFDRLEVGEGGKGRLAVGRKPPHGVFEPSVIPERGVGLGETRMNGGEADGLANEGREFSDGTAWGRKRGSEASRPVARNGGERGHAAPPGLRFSAASEASFWRSAGLKRT